MVHEVTSQRRLHRRAVTTQRRAAGRSARLPHDGVYVRLQPSAIHGLGVFAIRDIPKGAKIFGDDDEVIVRVPAQVVRALRGDKRSLYVDFCVLEQGEYLCPRSFNELTVSWYLNHSDEPSVECDQELTFFAARRIRRGEELTADYRTYSEDPVPWLARRTRRGARHPRARRNPRAG